MATVTVTLIGGLQIGEDVHTEAVLREPTGADLIDALEESEKLVLVPSADGGEAKPKMVLSPALMGLNVMRRQVVRIGTYEGPLTLAELKKLKKAGDIDQLQEKAMQLEQSSIEATVNQGRA